MWMITLTLLAASAGNSVWTAPNTLGPFPEPLRPQVRDGGLFFPSPLDDEVMQRLVHYYEMPNLCQVRLDNAKKLYTEDLETFKEQCDVDCMGRIADMQENEPITIWEILGASAGSVVVGILIGVLAL